MNAYLFTAAVTRWLSGKVTVRGTTTNEVRPVEGCDSAILFGDDPAQTQQRFEAGLRGPLADEDLHRTEITRIVAAQIVDHLFTESGPAPLDWAQIYREFEKSVQATALDDFEQGYWADVNELVRPDNLGPGIDSLQKALPEDISSGLNWSPDKQFYFLLSVLSPPPPPPDPDAGLEADDPELDAGLESSATDDSEPTIFPQLVDKEAAAVIRARNSVVAAWLWRKFAADTRLAANAIRIDSLCWAEGFAVGDDT
jgi:hypothetical protein